ncbi:hypothetical protein [Leisingera sp.]|uniref:hypothetical protein n=1 Tax=Leisingera sp. TaxID=1879318 RepID=UPI002B266FC0|nr:hypothetical protein [Leisingera sp.]
MHKDTNVSLLSNNAAVCSTMRQRPLGGRGRLLQALLVFKQHFPAPSAGQRDAGPVPYGKGPGKKPPGPSYLPQPGMRHVSNRGF